MAADVVGREQELGALHAFLERPLEGPAAFVLEGEAGIGKSTLWLAGVALHATEASSCFHRGPQRQSAASRTSCWETSSSPYSTTCCRF